MGALSLPALRGTGSSHTNISWNGIEINSPLSGQQSLSQLPLALFEDGQIQMGNGSVDGGNGAIGGQIALQSTVIDSSQISSNLEYGSFGYSSLSLGANLKMRSHGINLKAFQLDTDNNFPYSYNGEIIERSQNAFFQRGLMATYVYDLTNNLSIKTDLWLQEDTIQTPDQTWVVNPSRSGQRDTKTNLNTSLSYKAKRFAYTLNFSHLNHQMFYSNPSIRLFTNNHFKVLQIGGKSQGIIKRYFVESEAFYRKESADVGNFSHQRVRERSSFMVKIKRDFGRSLESSLGYRIEAVSNSKPAQGISHELLYNFSKSLVLFSKVNTGYRFPTFNDLFWEGNQAEGNPNLIPEQSLNLEVGSSIKVRGFQMQAALFRNYIRDWIIWQSLDKFRPLNIDRVLVLGSQVNIQMLYSRNQLRFRQTINLTFTKTQNLATDLRVPYSPDLIVGGESNLSYKRCTITFQNVYQSGQFTESENLVQYALQSYLINNVGFQYQLPLGKATLESSFMIQNLGNQNIYFRPGMPGPGRSFIMQIQCKNPLNI
jgi:iron complex outermembrane receptor protein